MKFYRKVLIVIIILLFLYLFWNFIKKQVKCILNGSFYESFESNPVQTSEVKAITNSNPIKINDIPAAISERPIIDYVIKSSTNSAVSGNYVSTDMIKYVLSRGCRFLDLEIFLINDDKGKPQAQVAYSTDSTFNTIDTNNSILLDDALLAIVSYAFATPTPNTNDPLFLQFRVKSNDPSIYPLVAKSVDFHLKNSLYKGTVTPQTQLSKLMRKIVLIMDKSINRNYADSCHCKSEIDKTCYDLTKYINIECGSTTLFTQQYNELLNQYAIQINVSDNCNHCTDVNNMRIVMPDDTEGNPTIDTFITDYGSQIVPYRFYILDTGLKDYETLFDNNKGAIIPLAYAIDYIKKHK
uniref:Phosphatidylinositol-specific phospholipase C X domain-containing protein n=1 Tax=viral metagenome TaxID=1070528 RepID=A0A6C0AS29_9ZZZZ